MHRKPISQLVVRSFFVGLLVIALLLPGQDLWSYPFISQVFDLLHFPCFFLLSLLLAPYLNSKLLVLGLSVFACGIEIVQPLLDRSADLQDVIFGLWGILTWYLFHHTYRHASYLASLSLVAFIAGSCLLLYPHGKSYIYQQKMGGFELVDSMNGWRNIDDSKIQSLERVELTSMQGFVLKGRALDYPWSGVSYDWSLPYSFAEKNNLSFDFYSHKADFELDVKLTSIMGNSIIVSKDIEQVGWKTINIPLSKYSSLDGQYLKSLSIYFDNEVHLDWYLLDQVLIQ